MTKEKKLGRPPFPPEKRRDAPVIFLRLTHEERAKVDAAAKKEGLTTIEWVRETIRYQF